MPITSSSIKATTKGFTVLLIESDTKSLQHHADVLLQNSYRVTTTTEASNGLSMMMNGHTYDCVLIDADMYEMDMKAFLHQVLRHQPQMSIILMAADDIHLRIPKEDLESEAVLCILKPCSPRDICDIWKHICRNRTSTQENDNAAINNITLGNFTDDQELDCNSQENDAMLKKVTYEDLFSDDDEDVDDDDDNDQEDVQDITTKENDGIGTTKIANKGKQLLTLKEKNNQLVEDYKYSKKRKVIKTRVTWKGVLDEKFKDAIKELGKQAHSKDILKHMNVPGLTRFHVASHLQKYQKKQKRIEASLAALAQRGNTLQVETLNKIKPPESIKSNVDASIIQSNSLLRSSKHNLVGISYMVIDNIRAKLQETPPLPVPQLTTNPLNNNGDDQETDHSFGVVESSNSGGQGSETQLIGHDYGNEIGPLVTSMISSHDHAFGEAMAPLGFGDTLASDYNLGIDVNFLFNDLDIGNIGDASGGDVGANVYPVSSHSGTLFDVENCINPGSTLDPILFGPDFSIPEFLTGEKDSLPQIHLPLNAIFPLDGSDGGFIDNELRQSDQEHIMSLFNHDGDGNLVHGQWYF